MSQIGGAEFDFRFRTYVEMRKWLSVLEHITEHFEQASHLATPHPLLIVLAFLWTQCDLGSLNQKCRVLRFCQSMSLAF